MEFIYPYQVCVGMTRRSASRGLLYSTPATTESTTETAAEEKLTPEATDAGEAAAADD
jgi:hypothetical protein